MTTFQDILSMRFKVNKDEYIRFRRNALQFCNLALINEMIPLSCSITGHFYSGPLKVHLAIWFSVIMAVLCILNAIKCWAISSCCNYPRRSAPKTQPANYRHAELEC